MRHCPIIFSMAISVAIPVTCIADDVRVTGRVISNVDSPVPSATVHCFGDGRPLTLTPQSVQLSMIDFVVPAFGGTHLTCTISAPRFKSVERTVPVVKGSATIGTVKVPSLPTLALRAAVVGRSADGYFTYVDLLMQNEAPQAIAIRQLDILGTARYRTECLDPRPALVFTLSDLTPIYRTKNTSDSVAVEIDSPPNNWKEQVLATATLERLGCQQNRIKMIIPYLFSLDPNEQHKIRVAVPATWSELKKGGKQPVPLYQWEMLSLEFLLDDGSRIESSIKTPMKK